MNMNIIINIIKYFKDDQLSQNRLKLIPYGTQWLGLLLFVCVLPCCFFHVCLVLVRPRFVFNNTVVLLLPYL